MSQTPEWPLTTEAMHSLLPAFEFTTLVSSNDQGAVFFANQKSLDRQVAVKVFSPALGSDPAFRQTFEASCKLAAGLRHPNLIGIIDSGNVGGLPYLVMEFVPGKSLARSTCGHMVEFGQSLSIIEAICAGLAHAHEAGLVHGHLDTLSILLNQHSVPKIGNFGFGRIVHTDPDAMAPRHFTAIEVLVNPAAATIASDVFSAAAIFHELITGQPYTPGSPPASTLCGCRKAIDAVLKQATDPDPGKRHADAATFLAALKKAAEAPRQVAAPATRVLLPAPKAASGMKLLTKLVLIVVLLCAIFFTWETLKKTRANREEQNREILAKQEAAAALIAEQKAMEQARRNSARPDPGRKIPSLERETPAQSLVRLRSALASGRRSEMPVGSVKKGDRIYFLVEQPMTWAEAALFAEEHGAHLAGPDTDLSWFNDKLTKGREWWLGAARKGGDSWILSEGKPWFPPAPPDGNGLFLLSTSKGGFASADEGQPRPFVIEWHADGTNPGSLANRLAATRASLKGNAPLFPPGTLVSGERRYLFVPRPVTWKEAGKLAKDGGGHLLVAASTGEIADLKTITRSFRAADGIWLGGSLENNHWLWITGEPWQAAAWVDQSAVSKRNGALAIRPGTGWIAMDRGETASGFLIEWSDDKDAVRPDVPAPGDMVAELNVRMKELMLTAAAKRDADLESNAKKLHWDLDSFLRKLSSNGREQWKPHVDEVKDCTEENRIITSLIVERDIAISEEMAKLINYHADKETEYDTRLEGECAKIRDAYVARLTAIRDEAKAAGQAKVAADAGEAIGVSNDLKQWISSFGIKFAEVSAVKVKESVIRQESDDRQKSDGRQEAKKKKKKKIETSPKRRVPSP